MMIPDHIATSLVMAVILLNKNKNKELIYSIVLAGILPDALVLIYLPGEINYLYHRLYTNSIVLMPFYTIILAAGFHFFTKQKIHFWIFFYYISLSWLLHIFLDLITPYGTQLLFPLKDNIYSLDILHSFDPIFLGISLLSIIILALNLRKKIFDTQSLGIFLAGLFAFYISVMLLFKSYHSYTNKAFITSNYSNIRYIHTIPKTYWRWRGIAQNDEKIVVINNNLSDIYEYSLKNIKLLPKSVRNDKCMIKFLSYARFPIYIINKNEISVFNAIYSPGSYRLTLKLDKHQHIRFRNISEFDLVDK